MRLFPWTFRNKEDDATKLIEFTISPEHQNIYPEPVEARAMIPDWYKRLPRVRDIGEGPITGTMKSCPPMMDTFTGGFIIPFPVQVTVRAKDPKNVNFEWLGDFGAISQHGAAQIEGSPFDHFTAYKFHNPWVVKTPPGYSCLFTNPFNHGPKPWSLFTAIVDTDVWNVPVNFPFVWTRYPYTDTIDEGGPMVQVIPFKRDDWIGNVRARTAEEEQEKYAEGERVFTKNRHYWNNRRHKKSWKINRGQSSGMPLDEIHKGINIENP